MSAGNNPRFSSPFMQPSSAGWASPTPASPHGSPLSIFDWRSLSMPTGTFYGASPLASPLLTTLSSGNSGPAGVNDAVRAESPINFTAMNNEPEGTEHFPAPASEELTKPPFDYKTLVKMALEHAGTNGMTICMIYSYVLENFPYYRSGRAPTTWRSRIRNVLTVNDCFRRIPDPKGGRKGRWVIHRNSLSSTSATASTSAAAAFALDTSSGVLKSPRAISQDSKHRTHQRSLSNLVLSPNTLSPALDQAAVDTLSPSNISLSELNFSFDDDEVRALEDNSAADMSRFSFSNFVAPRNLNAVYNPNYAAISAQAPSLQVFGTDGQLGISAASMEFVTELASQLKQECLNLTEQRRAQGSVAPVA